MAESMASGNRQLKVTGHSSNCLLPPASLPTCHFNLLQAAATRLRQIRCNYEHTAHRVPCASTKWRKIEFITS